MWSIVIRTKGNRTIAATVEGKSVVARDWTWDEIEDSRPPETKALIEEWLAKYRMGTQVSGYSIVPANGEPFYV